MPTIDHVRCDIGGGVQVQAASPPGIHDLTRPAGRLPPLPRSTRPAEVAVHPVLLKALTKAGFDRCEDGDRLSGAQLASLMNATPSVSERIALKMLIADAGIAPQVA